MKTLFYSAKKFEIAQFEALQSTQDLVFVSTELNPATAAMANGYEAVSAFVNDNISRATLEALAEHGIRFLALRCAGYNHVDLDAARELGIKVANVPEYSPNAIAEHTVALMLALNRKLIKAHNRVQELNFALDGLMGFDMHGKQVGVIGTGKIGKQTIKILEGFGCDIYAYDITPDKQFADLYGVEYVDLDMLFSSSDIITLHAPLTNDTRHMIDAVAIGKMKDGVMLINTSRGGLIHTKAAIDGLKALKIGYLGIDVYEEEKHLFFEDHSDQDVLQDDDIARLMTFKNVIITAHQAFLTREAVRNIAECTLKSLKNWSEGEVVASQL